MAGPPYRAFLGIPGIYLVLRYRPPGGQGEDIDEDQLFMFDRLSKRASEEGYDEYEDDIYLHEHIKQNYDPAGLTAPESMEDYVDNWEAPGPRDSGDLPGKS